MRPPFYIDHIEHFSGHIPNIAHLGESHDESHDQYRTLLTWCFSSTSSHTTNSYRADDKHGYRTSLRMYWDDTFGGFRRGIPLGWRREAVAFPSFRWLFEHKWRSLVSFSSLQSPSRRESTDVKTIYQLKHWSDCCTWTNELFIKINFKVDWATD